MVWAGRKPGVYNTWAEKKAQTDGFPGAKFRGFGTRSEAESAFGGNPSSAKPKSAVRSSKFDPLIGTRPTGKYLAVDAAYSHSTLICEWRGVMVDGSQQTEVFRSEAHDGGSENVGEFLAIIQGLKYLRESGIDLPLYSDSYNAQSWVKRKLHNSTAKRSTVLTNLLVEGVRYLIENPNKGLGIFVKIIDWKSSSWGEIPAALTTYSQSLFMESR